MWTDQPPKLNGKLFDAKSKLREVLMTPYPYNFENGSSDVLTLEQVFYKLYSDYVAAKEAWAQKQLDKRNELEQKYPDNTKDDCVFPCYPTAFVVAKDVTIKFVKQTAISTSFAQSVEEHFSRGGGFFIFGGSSSSASKLRKINTILIKYSLEFFYVFIQPLYL